MDLTDQSAIAVDGFHWIDNSVFGDNAHLAPGEVRVVGRPLHLEEKTLCGLIVFGTVSRTTDPVRACGRCLEQFRKHGPTVSAHPDVTDVNYYFNCQQCPVVVAATLVEVKSHGWTDISTFGDPNKWLCPSCGLGLKRVEPRRQLLADWRVLLDANLDPATIARKMENAFAELGMIPPASLGEWKRLRGD